MTIAQDPAAHLDAPEVSHDEDLDPRAVDDTARSIAQDHPSVPLATVHAVLSGHLSSTADARVRNFRLLLAERSTRRQLSHLDRADRDRAVADLNER